MKGTEKIIAHIRADGDAEAVLLDKALLEANQMELPLCVQGWQRKHG